MVFSQEKNAGSGMHEVILGYVCRLVGSCPPEPGWQDARAFAASNSNKGSAEFI